MTILGLAWLLVLAVIVGLGYLKARRRTPEQEKADLDEQAAALRAQAEQRERDRILGRRERDLLFVAKVRADQRRREREKCVSDLRGGGHHAA